MTIKKIKVYNLDKLKFEYRNIDEVKAYYNENKSDFESIKEFLDMYCISYKHKRYIEKGTTENQDYHYMILDDYDNIIQVYDDFELAKSQAKELDLYKVITFQIIDTLELRKGEND
jgi:hypothetical protein